MTQPPPGVAGGAAAQPPAVPGGRGRAASAAALLRRPAIGVSLGVLVLIALAALAVPPLLPYGPNELASDEALAAPSAAHPLGTDELGRDLLARLLAGVRVSLLVIVASVPLSLLAGGLLGLFSTAGRWTDTPVQRFFDVVLAFPALILGLAVAAVMGVGTGAVIVTAAVATTPVFGRVVRGAVRAQSARDYVLSERVLGVGTARLYLRHILPNCFDVLLVQTALACSTAVFLEGGLSFLGLGVPPPDASLGSLLNASLTFLTSSPFYAVGPLVVISALVLCFTLLADALNRELAGR
ncbi:ABC transporter permease [Streptomyces sp. 7-21]|uniref:ABC transporter permease n=1 Tax=Streptomyces sp. 7-21 TaxID=2802283 RepID=UPI00191CCF37|nr:ABC transporter permease [Streptomyces sp. 7-21]MBL1068830.1 ABC transporter permease [Streptomyces sp. 7-21]